MIRRLFPLTVVTIAALFGLATLLPNALQRADDDYLYQGIEMMPTDSEIHYAARVREIVDGFWTTANVFYSAPKDQPYLQPPLPEWTIAMTSRLVGLDPVRGFIVARTLLAVLTFLAVTWSFVAITRRRWESLIAVTFLFFCGALLGAPWDFPQYILGNVGPEGFLRFARPINPLWTATWFFGMLGIFSLWYRRRSTPLIVAVAACLVVLLYSYVYAWTYAGTTFGLLLGWYAWKRDWRRCADFLLLGGIFVVFGLPYFVHVREALAHPLYVESAMRLGMVPLRTPVIGVWLVVFLLLSVVSHRVWPGMRPLVVALALGGAIAINQQVVTGYFLVPHHYHWYFLQPLASVFAMIMAMQWIGRHIRPSFRAGILVPLLCLSVFFGFAQQYHAYQARRAQWGGYQEAMPVLRWLDEHTKPGDVVFSRQEDITSLLPIYTSADVYTATNAINYIVPTARARDVWFFVLWVQGVTAQQAAFEFPTTLRSELSSNLYAIYYRELTGDFRAIPDDVVSQNVQAYAEYLQLSFGEKLAKYPLLYLLVTPADRPTEAWQQLLARSTRLFEQDGYSVFLLKTNE